MNQPFEDLLDTLETMQADEMLAKGMSGKSKKKTNEQEEDYYDDSDLLLDEDEDEDTMHKAMTVQLPDGEEALALDGDALMKSFGTLIDERLQTRDETLAKALGGLINLVHTQSAAIADLQGQVSTFAKSGSGRQSVFKSLHTGQADPAQPAQLLAKAVTLMDAGKITGRELQTLDAAVRHKTPLDPAIVAKILQF